MAKRTAKAGSTEDEGKTPDGPSCPVVGIGASAGGIAALQSFFSSVSADSGVAYVVVQHLDPEHASNLAQILQRHSAIAFKVAQDGAAIEPNTVYVIPPAVGIGMRGCRLHLEKAAEARSRRTTVDDFLISLAEDQGEKPPA